MVEADESDKSFTYLSPAAVIVTNVETDHLDHYKDLDEIYDQFEEFIRSVPAAIPSWCAAMTRSSSKSPVAARRGGHLRFRRVVRRAHRGRSSAWGRVDVHAPLAERQGGRGLHSSRTRRPQRRQRSRGLDPRRLLGMDVDLAAEKLPSSPACAGASIWSERQAGSRSSTITPIIPPR